MIAAVESLLGPERGHEDEAGDRRADVRDHVEQPRDHAESDRVARAEDPGRRPLDRPGDRRDHDDADRPARDRLRHALPDGEPTLVLARHEDARQRALEVPHVREQEQADEEDREAGEEDGEEAARDAEHRRDRVGDRGRDLLGPVLHVPCRARVAEPRGELVGRAQLPTSSGSSCRKSRTLPTSGTRKQQSDHTTASAVPSTVTVAARPRDIRVFAITKRTGYSNTNARKMPTKTIRNVSPIAANAASPIAAATRKTVRIGRRSSTRRDSAGSIARPTPLEDELLPANRPFDIALESRP